MKKYFLLLFVLFFTAQLSAQQKTRSYFMPAVSLLNGDNYVSLQGAFSGGIRTGRLEAGIGVGIDYYKIRTVPLFLELRAALTRNAKFFAYASGGANFMWPLETQYVTHWTGGTGFSRDRFYTGVVADAGLGYRVKVNAGSDVLLSIGYSLKTVHQRYEEMVNKEFPPYTLELRERKFHYMLNRIAIRAGLRF